MHADILLMLIPEGMLTLAIDCTCSLQNNWLWYILELENREGTLSSIPSLPTFIYPLSAHFSHLPYSLSLWPNANAGRCKQVTSSRGPDWQHCTRCSLCTTLVPVDTELDPCSVCRPDVVQPKPGVWWSLLKLSTPCFIALVIHMPFLGLDSYLTPLFLLVPTLNIFVTLAQPSECDTAHASLVAPW